MSADSWAKCPKCVSLKQKEIKEAWNVVENEYGKVSRSDYEEAVNTSQQTFSNMRSTFREDYEVGISGEDFVVSYRGYCTECEFTLSKEIKEEVTF